MNNVVCAVMEGGLVPCVALQPLQKQDARRDDQRMRQLIQHGKAVAAAQCCIHERQIGR